MSFLRLQYHHRKIAAASCARHEADFYETYAPCPWSDSFDHCSGELGANWTQWYSSGGTMVAEGKMAAWHNDVPPLLMQSFGMKLADSLVDQPTYVYTQFGRQELARTCSICQQEWQPGDEAVSHNGGPFFHPSCAPKTEEALLS